MAICLQISENPELPEIPERGEEIDLTFNGVTKKIETFYIKIIFDKYRLISIIEFSLGQLAFYSFIPNPYMYTNKS